MIFKETMENLPKRRNNFIKAVVIANRAGCPLVSVVISPLFNIELIGGFIAAIGQFANEFVQQIEEIYIKGLALVLFVAFKHNLFIVAAMDENVSRGNIRAEAEQALDEFYLQYKDKIESWDGKCGIFNDFEGKLQQQISDYLAHANVLSEKVPSKLFSKIFSWFRGAGKNL